MISFNTGLSLAAAVIPGGGAWTPAKEPGGTFNLWLDGADTATITQSGGLVSQWSDKSGAGNHATQATSAKQPAPAAGGGVDFSTSRFLLSNLSSSADTQSLFAVIDMAALSGDRSIFGTNIATGQRQFRIGGNAPASLQMLRSGQALEHATAGIVSVGKHVVGITIGGVGTATINFYMDGANGGIAGDHGTTFGSANTTAIGARDGATGGAEFLNGIIREGLALPSVPGVTLMNNIFTYLKNKWGTP